MYCYRFITGLDYTQVTLVTNKSGDLFKDNLNY